MAFGNFFDRVEMAAVLQNEKVFLLFFGPKMKQIGFWPKSEGSDPPPPLAIFGTLKNPELEEMSRI